MPKVGDVMYIDGEDGDDDPPGAATTFQAAVFVQDHPGQLRCSVPFFSSLFNSQVFACENLRSFYFLF